MPSGKLFMLFLSSADFFQNQLFRKILSGIPSECQIAWIQIRPNVLLGLTWVQTVCKSYQQTTLGGKELSNEQIEISVLITKVIWDDSNESAHMHNLIKAFTNYGIIGRSMNLFFFFFHVKPFLYWWIFPYRLIQSGRDSPFYILRGYSQKIPNYDVFQYLKFGFILANIADPDEMLHHAAFHLGLHCLSKYPFLYNNSK